MKPAIMRDRFAQFLDGFVEHRARADATEDRQASEDHKRFNGLLEGFREADEQYRRRQEEVAEDFNLLDVMQLTGKEVRHSMVLAWLLDHDLHNLGTHAQGNLGFRLFLEEFGLAAEYAMHSYSVRRNAGVDIEVVRKSLQRSTKKLFDDKELSGAEWGKPGDENLISFASLSRRKLLDALFQGDGEVFVSAIVSEFERMARFVPVLDGVFREHVTNRKGEPRP
jgi:hypothetical protein